MDIPATVMLEYPISYEYLTETIGNIRIFDVREFHVSFTQAPKALEVSFQAYPSEEDILKSREIIEREILTDTLEEAIKVSWSEIEGEVMELLKDYEISPDYAGWIISEVKKKVRSKLNGLPNEEWLTDILSKLYIRLAYELLHI
jgi:hypothetical protein